jgi:hypothetical protein
MTAADENRINAMATARAIKATRLWLALVKQRAGHVPSADDIATLPHHLKDSAVTLAGVKVASEGTWKVVQAIAAVFEGERTRETSEALPVASGPPEHVVLPDGCVDGHSPDRIGCELGSDWG